MKEIKLYNIDKVVFVDDEDYDSLNKYNWSLEDRVIRTKINDRKVSIGTFILGAKDEFQVDHKDRDIFNNIRSNLRYATISENCMNKGISKRNTSGYKGVCWRTARRKWQASIKVNGKLINIGSSDSKIEAAKMYNAAALKHFGPFAFLNDI